MNIPKIFYTIFFSNFFSPQFGAHGERIPSLVCFLNSEIIFYQIFSLQILYRLLSKKINHI